MGQLCFSEDQVCRINTYLDRNLFQGIVVCENDDLGYLIGESLSKTGITVRSANPNDDFDKVVALQKEVKFIVFDTGPMTDNYNTIERILKLRFDFTCHIVCLIPPFRPDSKLQCLAAGVDFVLEKPVKSEDLLHLVGKVINSCGQKTSSGCS